MSNEKEKLTEVQSMTILKIQNACYKKLSDMKGKIFITPYNEFILEGSFTPEQLRRIAEVMEMFMELLKSFKIPEDYVERL